MPLQIKLIVFVEAGAQSRAVCWGQELVLPVPWG